ncbi:unnamed protein product [Lathyrus sativus]|nr:unnamed protein product [Lathyrus sativus]
MAWVSWFSVCKTKEHGGLGIKDISLFNRALLSKWLWRLIHEQDAIWKPLLVLKYGSFICRIVSNIEDSSCRLHSPWWKNITRISDSKDEDGFMMQLACKLGEGTQISFWNSG